MIKAVTRRRLLAACLCLAMGWTLFPVTALADRATPLNEHIEASGRIADPGTMDAYMEELFSDGDGDRYAGRIWADKTVFAFGAGPEDGGLTGNILPLDEDTDGYEGTVGFDADFLNVYSALGSTQVVNDYMTSPLDLVIVLDMSGSMAQSTQFPIQADRNYGYQETMEERIENSRIQATLNAVNETIDAVMADNRQNRVAVCVYGANATVLMPLAHYQRVDEEPYLTVGGMETLYDRDDYSTPAELGQPDLPPEEGIWTINRDACYTVVANALYDQSPNAPDTFETVWNRTVSNNVKNSVLHPDPDLDGDGQQLPADQYIGYMTNTQGGIDLGMKQLADTEDMIYTETFEEGETVNVARVPSVMILTDGGANFAFNPPAEDSWHELPWNAGDEWYDVYLPQEDITDLYNMGIGDSKLTSIPAYDDGGIFYDSDADVGGTPSTILEVLMTASYMKTVVEKHYERGWEQGRAEQDSRVPLSVFTVSVDAVHLPAWGRYRIYPTMDPEVYFNATMWDETCYACIGSDFQAPLPWRAEQDNQMEDLLPYTYGKWEQWKALSSPDESISVLADWIGNPGSIGPEVIQLDDDEEHTLTFCSTLRIHPLPDDQSYMRTDGSGETAEEVHVTNQDVIDNIFYSDMFYDVESEELSGVFQEVVEMLTASVFVPVAGKNAAGAEDSVTYRDQLGQYMQVKNDSVTVLASGKDAAWQRWDMAALLFGQMRGLARAAVYDAAFNAAHMTVRDDGTESFAEGWYRGSGAAAEYCGPEDAPDDPWANGWVYRVGVQTLIDFVPTISGEDTSDIQDDTVYTLYRFADGGKELDRLRINPTYGQIVPVTLENMWEDLEEKPADNGLYKEERGIYRLNDIRVWTESRTDSADGGYMQSVCADIPVSALPTQSAEISMGRDGPDSFVTNLADRTQSTPFRLFYTVGLDDELIEQGLYSGEDGVDVEALPRQYLNGHRSDGIGSVWFLSDGYVGGADSATVSFAPSGENCYYLNQQALPLYAHAYRAAGGSAELTCVDVPAGQEGQADSGTVWADGSVGGALWRGGAYMGTYADEAAYAAALDELEERGGVTTIRDSFGHRHPYAEDGIVFLQRDMITDGTVRPEDYYFFSQEHYLPGDTEASSGTTVQLAACSRGADFAAGVVPEELDADSIVCWADGTGSTDVIADFAAVPEDITRGRPTVEKLTYRGRQLRDYLGSIGVPAAALAEQAAYWLAMQEQLLYRMDIDGNGRISGQEYTDAGLVWVQAAKPGSTRVGEFAGTVRAKELNRTLTADDSYTPAADTSRREDGAFLLSDSYGNSGKLTIRNTLLYITNSIEAPDEMRQTPFRYQLYVEGFTGAYDAIVLRYDPDKNGGAGGWQQQVTAAEVNTNSSGLVLAANGYPAVVDGSGVFVGAGPAVQGGSGNYYVYAAPEGTAASRAPAAGTVDGTEECYLEDVWLVPTDQVDSQWAFSGTDMRDGLHLDSLFAARLEPDSESTDIHVLSDYLVDVTYQTQTIFFGSRQEENGGQVDLTANDLADRTPFWLNDTTCAAIPGQQRAVMETTEYDRAAALADGAVWIGWDEIAAHTAEVVLSDGEGLLLSVRPGSGYRVTEVGMVGEGFLLREAVQECEHEAVRYGIDDMSQPSGSAFISAWSDIGDDGTDMDHQNCDRLPNGPDEYIGGEAVRHWTVYDGLQMDYSTISQMDLLTQARFSTALDGERTYGMYGMTDSAEAGLHYVNGYEPSALVISNWLKTSGDNVRLDQEDMDQMFVFTLSLDEGSALAEEGLSYTVTGYEAGQRVILAQGRLLPGGSQSAEEGDIPAENGAWRFTLQGDQQMTVGGLTQGVSYRVTQQPAAGFAASAAPGGTVDKDQTVTVTGTMDGADRAAQVVTFTNTKTVRNMLAAEDGLDILLWTVLAAALVLNVAVTAIVLVKRHKQHRRHKHRHARR